MGKWSALSLSHNLSHSLTFFPQSFSTCLSLAFFISIFLSISMSLLISLNLPFSLSMAHLRVVISDNYNLFISMGKKSHQGAKNAPKESWEIYVCLWPSLGQCQVELCTWHSRSHFAKKTLLQRCHDAAGDRAHRTHPSQVVSRVHDYETVASHPCRIISHTRGDMSNELVVFYFFL